jgi:putative oxidoreductase
MPSSASSRTDLALLLVRAVVGLTFLMHGLDKLEDLSGTEQFLDSLSIPLPGLTAPFVALIEVVGGIALIVGLLAPLFGLALAGDMLVAALTQHIDKGFFVADGGYELVLILGAASLGILLAGAGRFSVDGALRLGERLPGYPGGRGRRADRDI